MNDWLIDWVIDWLIDWLIYWLIEWFIDWLIDWLIGLINWLIDLVPSLIKHPLHCPTQWTIGRAWSGRRPRLVSVCSSSSKDLPYARPWICQRISSCFSKPFGRDGRHRCRCPLRRPCPPRCRRQRGSHSRPEVTASTRTCRWTPPKLPKGERKSAQRANRRKRKGRGRFKTRYTVDTWIGSKNREGTSIEPADDVGAWIAHETWCPDFIWQSYLINKITDKRHLNSFCQVLYITIILSNDVRWR